MKHEYRVTIKGYYTPFETIKLFFLSYFFGLQCRGLYKDLKYFCMFIGYPRSGHSLVGSLLDAHPNIVISHELDALYFIKAGFSTRQIYSLILNNSITFTREGRRWKEYAYRVPNQWQGRFDKVLVIGDKKGGETTRRLGNDPHLLIRLLKRIRKPIKFIHVVRNPYDNISGIASLMNWSLEKSMKYYFSLCAMNEDLKRCILDKNIFEIRHEDLIAQPENILMELCEFYELECGEDYLRDCSAVIFKSPHSKRQKTNWTPKFIQEVQDRMKAFPFLRGYSF